ncbi:1-aminocyclopropane-1-carboxylate deaminase/D-cysteine desulfhydrase [Gilvimarinus sp. DA14]|uniref:1-aminocyclopropane-1-carboxylate deaminase/D-cysteine desulfhydrase n=1 Tax=Gilvimarinus sp. DA14 TaxID=2956798 RepID=UPI0020B7EA48|nr:pyridoxal-phosphate dependent enzyme [Gilvimarinus sp. DA14]UTF60718.1 pyridoxal-phosphate dependent enzyme [Gilvimarinus sp. DA14]
MGACESETELLRRALQVPYHRLELPACDKGGVEVLLRRDDLIDPHASGNKFYKLFYNLKAAQRAGATRLVTAGGAWSNHLYALAHTARNAGFLSRALVRGERPGKLSQTLQDAERVGMELVFVSRDHYRSICQQGPNDLGAGDYYIPEGGANGAGEKGAAVLGQAIGAKLGSSRPEFVCMAVGTGGTLKGVAQALPPSISCVGVSVLKAPAGSSAIGRAMGAGNWRLLWGFAGNGYGRALPEPMVKFWRDFELKHQIPLDPVYTVKALYAVESLAAQGYWPRNSRIIVVHSGGLQGRRGFAAQIKWPEPTYSLCC